MATHKHIDRICAAAALLALLLCIVFMNGEALGIQASATPLGYETRLFDTDRVHTVDIVMNDWESFIDTCENEEYAMCSVVIDGEPCGTVGIRAKGNTSLSSVSSMGSDRYSFKLEFDQYDSTKSYYGLDKLSLNNLIQDTTMMKDYLTYQMMGSFGAAAPLCSYVYITVNGEDWGLYLAVEGVEDAFLQRNYGTDHGELYKPDSMSFGGGRGNGKDFDMDRFTAENGESAEGGESGRPANRPQGGQPMPGGQMPDFSGGGQMQGGFTRPDSSSRENSDFSAIFGQGGGNFDPFSMPEGFEPSAMGGNFDTSKLPEDFDISAIFGQGGFDTSNMPEDFDPSAMMGGEFDPAAMFGGGGGMGGFGMGSGDVKLQYNGDDTAGYSNIFNQAKTDITEADKTRLIRSLKGLSEGTDIESVVDVEQVMRYFVVHNFVVNGDSYTGTMVHNYYLYEEDGKLSMLPWDYNLAFGTFQGGNASSAVNDPIDSPLSVSGSGDRPMADWIFNSEEYTARYHELFAQFLESTDFAALIDKTAALIAPYVERDPTKFCTVEEFETGVAAMKEFCLLREESVLGQLNGTIPATDAGQSADSSALVETGDLNLSDMGSMGMGGGFGGGFGGDRGQNIPGRDQNKTEETAPSAPAEEPSASGETEPPTSGRFPADGQFPANGQFPNGGQFPSGGQGQMPSGGQFPGGGQMPSGGQGFPQGGQRPL